MALLLNVKGQTDVTRFHPKHRNIDDALRSEGGRAKDTFPGGIAGTEAVVRNRQFKFALSRGLAINECASLQNGKCEEG